jgi:hypothetical protein
MPNDRKILPTNENKTYQHFRFQGPPYFSRIGIFGMQTHHLVTLLVKSNVGLTEHRVFKHKNVG